ncbi:hypothetical protein [Paenisporosarcina sp.]|uniref:hypothetical protein n=1 Tax=Paenisporosarcina sp. TaxID=1932001 RepID=UPI003C75A2DC
MAAKVRIALHLQILVQSFLCAVHILIYLPLYELELIFGVMIPITTGIGGENNFATI